MKNEKGIIIIVIILVLSAFYLPNIIKNIKSNSDSIKGGLIPYSYNIAEKKMNKITLSDSVESVVEILGEPKSIAEKQTLIDISPEITKNCQFMIYDDFVVLIRENKVSGWCFDYKKIDAKSNLFYLPKLEEREEPTSFLDFYKKWEKIGKEEYPKVLYNLGECYLGNMYFCASWNPDGSTQVNQMIICFYSDKYKISQMYVMGDKVLDSKFLLADDLSLIADANDYNSLLLGKNLSYAKKYFSEKNIDDEGTRVKRSTLEKISYIHFYSDNRELYYNLEFNGLDKCYYFGITYK
jgi:hypothetical protein